MVSCRAAARGSAVAAGAENTLVGSANGRAFSFSGNRARRFRMEVPRSQQADGAQSTAPKSPDGKSSWRLRAFRDLSLLPSRSIRLVASKFSPKHDAARDARSGARKFYECDTY